MQFAPEFFGNDAAILARLTAIEEKTALIGTSDANLQGPTLSAASLRSPFVIGDDYTVAVGRPLRFGPVSCSVEPVSAKVGFWLDAINRFVLDADESAIEPGDEEDTYFITFDCPRALSLGKKPGTYEWSADLRDAAGNKITYSHADGIAGRPNYARWVPSRTED